MMSNYHSIHLFHSHWRKAALARLANEQIAKNEEGKLKSKDVVHVPCFPFFDILNSLGNPIVDYFSLDIEGFEMKVRIMSKKIHMI